MPRVRKPGPRRHISPWLPLAAVLVVLSPVLLLIAGVAVFLPPPFRLHPATLMVNLGRVMNALSGDEIEPRGPPRLSDERP